MIKLTVHDKKKPAALDSQEHFQFSFQNCFVNFGLNFCQFDDINMR